MIVLCMECFSRVDSEKVEEVGIVQCQCGLKIAKDREQQLTVVDDEMPADEYLGG